LGAIIDENGVIANYEELMQNWIDDYNAAIEKWNNSEQEESDQDKLDEAE